METIQISEFTRGYIAGLLPFVITILYLSASALGKWSAEKAEMKRLKRKALERMAGER